jgi:hypothetical protein
MARSFMPSTGSLPPTARSNPRVQMVVALIFAAFFALCWLAVVLPITPVQAATANAMAIGINPPAHSPDLR